MSSFSVDFDDSQEPYIIDSNPESGKQMGFAFEPFHTITQSTKYEFANGSEEKKQIRMLCAIIKSDLFLFSKINHELCNFESFKIFDLMLIIFYSRKLTFLANFCDIF